MTFLSRSTKIVGGRLAMRQARLEAARARHHGLQIMTFEQAAVRSEERRVGSGSLAGLLGQ